MTWAVTADVDRFDEAVDWFLARTVVTGERARDLDARAKAEAFWVGGGLQLTQIQRVFDSIAEAAEKGEPFEEWRKRVRDELRNDAHAETVFRNAVQRQYNAGRWAQMTEPSVAQFRPFWMYDAILDGATTTICRERNGTILPHDHSWWDENYPPLHHRCRSSIRNLRRSEAERRGLTQTLPETAPAPGFGISPRIQAPPWKPDSSKHDPTLLAELERKQQETGGQRPKASTDRYSAETWKAHYEDYGEAAESLAEGRASLERGLDLTVREARELLLEPAQYAPGVAELRRSLAGVELDVTLRNAGGELDPSRKGAAALAGHLARLSKGPQLSNPTLDLTPEGQRVMGFYSQVSGRGLRQPVSVRFVKIVGRSGVRVRLADFSIVDVEWEDAPTLAHEWGHTLELLNPSLLRRSLAFLRRRTRGELLQQLNTLKPGYGFGPGEVAKPDQFLDAYIGKWYEHAGTQYSTELTSMASEILFAGATHWGMLSDLLRKDPELFLFLLGQYRG